MGRLPNLKQRPSGRHTPEAISATTIPDQSKDETAVMSLRSNATLETLWTSVLGNHNSAVQAKQAADGAQGASERAAADAARLHQEGMEFQARADAKLREAEEIAKAARADKQRADEAGAAHKKLTAITADLAGVVDALHAKAAAADPNLAHPRQHRPFPAAPQQEFSPQDSLGDAERHGPVSNATAEFPPVPPADDPQVAAFRKDVA